MPKKNVTFNDIAAYTHFSKTTISRYFNRPDSVTPANQEKIREALDALGYKENKVAKILANGRTELIGVIFPNLFLHYFSDMLNQILSTYEQYGYKFMVFSGGSGPDDVRDCIEEMIAYNVEGLIVMDHQLSSKELAGFNVPIVSIEREDEYISSVNCDNYMGAVQAVSLLAKNGCEIIIHINSPTPEQVPAYQRIKGFEDFCTEHNLPHRMIIVDAGVTYESISAAMEKLVDEIDAEYHDKRVGVFLSDDTRANAYINSLIRKYRGYPSNYQIVGFDNSPVSIQSTCPFTTIGQQISVIAHTAVDLLHDQIELRHSNSSETFVPVHKVITPVLIRRDTTD